MFGSSVIEIAIGVVFVYVVLSLSCTAVNEWIASVINKRGKNLFEGIKNLLNDPTCTGLAHQVYNHGLVNGISKDPVAPDKRNRPPSYLPAKNFSLALLDIFSANGVVSAAHGEALTRAESAYDDWHDACQRMKVTGDDPSVAGKKSAGELARAGLVDAARVAKTAYLHAVDVALGGAAAVPQTLGQARDAYVKAIKEAASPPTDEQRVALDRAGAQYDSAARAVLTEAQHKIVAPARGAYETASAAVKILDARIAAQALARKPEDMSLIKKAADSLEQALAVGRKLASDVPNQLDNMQAAISRLPEGHTKESLLVIIEKSRREAKAVGDEIKHFQEQIESWFNDAMDRVGGWYKRWTQRWQVLLAAIIVVMLNADTLMLTKCFSTDKDLRAAVVAKAQTTSLDQIKPDLESLSLPLGWSSDEKDSRRFPWIVDKNDSNPARTTASQFFLKLLGLLISVAAVSLGAPFWFDMLSKFINIRGAGTPPGEKKKSAK